MLGLSLGLTHSTVKMHTGLQQKQIRWTCGPIVAYNQTKGYWWLFRCCRWTCMGLIFHPLSRDLSHPKSRRIPDYRYLHLEIQLKVIQPFSHPEFCGKHSILVNRISCTRSHCKNFKKPLKLVPSRRVIPSRAFTWPKQPKNCPF